MWLSIGHNVFPKAHADFFQHFAASTGGAIKWRFSGGDQR